MTFRYVYYYLAGFVAVVVVLALLINNFVLPATPAMSEVKPDVLSNFVSANLKSEHVPELDIGSDSNISFTKWSTEEANFTAYVAKNLKNESLREYRMVIRTPAVYQNLNMDFVGSFLQNVGTDWICGTSSAELKTCESFTVTLEGKEGKAMLMYSNSTALVVCKIPRTSELYDGSTSCL